MLQLRCVHSAEDQTRDITKDMIQLRIQWARQMRAMRERGEEKMPGGETGKESLGNSTQLSMCTSQELARDEA